MNGKIKILILGCYGEGNVGDELILASILTNIKNAINNVEFIIFSSNIQDTISTYKCRAILDLNLFKPKHWVGLFLKLKITDILRAIKWCDLLVVGGGELIREDYGFSPLLGILDKVLLAKIFRKKVTGYALGVGKIRGKIGKFLARTICNNMTIITTRDHESKNNLEAIGISVKSVFFTGDPVLNTPFIPNGGAQERNDTSTFKIGVSLRKNMRLFSTRERSAFFSKIAKSIMLLLSRDNSIRMQFIPMQQEDRDAFDTILDNLKKNGIELKIPLSNEKSYSVLDIVNSIADCDILIGMRLHCIILAAISCRPFLALNYDPKIRKFSELMGMQEYLIDINASHENEIVEKVVLLKKNYDNISKKLKDKVGLLRESEKLNAQYLSDLLKNIDLIG